MRRAVLGAVLVAGFAVGILVAMIGWSPRAAHAPTGLDWSVQAAVLLVAVVLVAIRVRGKR